MCVRTNVFFRIAHARAEIVHFACMHSLGLEKCHCCGAVFGCSGAEKCCLALF